MIRFTLFLGLFSLAISGYCGEWIPIDIHTDIPAASPNDVLDLYYLAAPLMYCDYLDELAAYGGYHGGVGIVNRNTNFTFTINFDGYPTFGSTFFPIITKLSNGSYNLEWQNFGRVYFYHGINDTYWHSLGPYPNNRQLVATMTGPQFNTLRNWLAGTNATHQYYNPWFLYADFPSKPWVAGYECFQFAFNVIQKVSAIGGKLNPDVKTLKVSLGIALSPQNATKISFYDPVWHDQIVKFFLLIERLYNELGWLNFLEELLLVISTGDFFFRINGDYYFTQLTFPFFEMHWADFPLSSWNITGNPRSFAFDPRAKYLTQ